MYELSQLQTINTLVPHIYYLGLTACSDIMMMELLCLDQAKLLCKNLVRDTIMPRKDFYRTDIKRVCNRIYNPKGNSLDVDASSRGLVFKGFANRIEYGLESNMSEKDQLKFSLMASEIDDVIKDDLQKLANTCLLVTGRQGIKEQVLFSEILRVLLFLHVVQCIIIDANNLSKGNKFALCKDPENADCRLKAYNIDKSDLEGLIACIHKIIAIMAKGQDFEVPYTNEIRTGIACLAHKLVDTRTIYKAGEEAGLDLRLTSDSYNYPEAIAERLQQKRIEVKPTAPAKDTNDKAIEQLAESKGWKIKK